MQYPGPLISQPACPENCVGNEYGCATHERIWRSKVRDSSGESITPHFDTLQGGTKYHALHYCRDSRTNGECDVPTPAQVPDLRTKLKADSPQSQSEQHDDDREIERRHENAVRDGKRCKQHH